MREGTMWKRMICGAAVVAALALPAAAQVGFGITFGRTPPPPVRYERRGPMPGPGYAWVDGYWNLDRGRYVWVPGRWQQPPYAGAYWSHPHYDHYNDGWHYHDGHWDREDHGDHYDNGQNRDRGNDRH